MGAIRKRLAGWLRAAAASIEGGAAAGERAAAPLVRRRRGVAAHFVRTLEAGSYVSARAMSIEVGCTERTARKYLDEAVGRGVLEHSADTDKYHRPDAVAIAPGSELSPATNDGIPS